MYEKITLIPLILDYITRTVYMGAYLSVPFLLLFLNFKVENKIR